MASFEIIKSGNDLILKNKYGIYSKMELEMQLREGRLTEKDLCNIYNLKTYQMGHVLYVLGIFYRNNVNDTRIYDSYISPSIHQVLLGTLMGDAFMHNFKTYSLCHGINQMDYCFHVAERLHQFVASIGDRNTLCKTEKAFSFWTYRHNVFIPYFQKFYSHGKQKKYFTIDTVSDLEPEGLAYWFMDDGKYGEYGYYLCVGNISIQEGDILRSLLKNKFDIDTTFQIHDKEKGHFNIYIRAKSRNKFIDLIQPYIIPSMRYKLEGKVSTNEHFSMESVVPLHRQLCEKAGRFIRYYGDKDIQKKLESENIIKDKKSIYIDGIVSAIKNNTQISRTSFRKVPSELDLKSLFEQGLTDKQIANKYGFGRKRISDIRHSMGIKRKKCRISRDQIERLRILLMDPNMRIQSVMKEMHISFYTAKKLIVNISK